MPNHLVKPIRGRYKINVLMIYPTSSTQPGVHFLKVSYVNYGLYIPRIKRMRTLLTIYHLNKVFF